MTNEFGCLFLLSGNDATESFIRTLHLPVSETKDSRPLRVLEILSSKQVSIQLNSNCVQRIGAHTVLGTRKARNTWRHSNTTYLVYSIQMRPDSRTNALL